MSGVGMADVSDPIPSYFELIKGIFQFTAKTVGDYIEGRKPSPEEEKWHYFNFYISDILYVVLLAAMFTVIRYFATNWLFKPIASHYCLTPVNQKKMPESAWKFVYYLGAWSLTFYVVILSGHYRFFQKPSCVWDGWDLNKDLPTDIYLMYVIQSGFYAHSLYATLFLDTWRKDSVVMMIHHVLTLLLVSISYSLRYQNIGSVVLFLHDVCDIQLEFTKLNVYFKIQDGKLVKKHETLANVTFFCFAITWFFCRLYLYPLKVLYSTTAVVFKKELILPCSILMNTLLWVLQAMNVYWFLFIMGVLVRVTTGQIKDVDDMREYDVEEKLSQELSAKLDSVSGSLLEDDTDKNNIADGIISNGDHVNHKDVSRKRLKKTD